MTKLLTFTFILLATFTNCNDTTKATSQNKLEIISHITSEGVFTKSGRAMEFPKQIPANIIYFVRHAEKETTGENPKLTKNGEARAENLAKLFKAIPLNQIFSTNYKRTILTATPTSRSKKLKLDFYGPKQLDGLVRNQLKGRFKKHVLVVGHSNTTPDILNLLQDKKVYTHIPENEYDHLYVAVIDGNKILELKEFKYN